MYLEASIVFIFIVRPPHLSTVVLKNRCSQKLLFSLFRCSCKKKLQEQRKKNVRTTKTELQEQRKLLITRTTKKIVITTIVVYVRTTEKSCYNNKRFTLFSKPLFSKTVVLKNRCSCKY